MKKKNTKIQHLRNDWTYTYPLCKCIKNSSHKTFDREVFFFTLTLVSKNLFSTNEKNWQREFNGQERTRALEVDGWLIQLLALKLQLKMGVICYAKHRKRKSPVFVYAKIILARRWDKRKKERESEKIIGEREEGGEGGKSGQRT